MTNQQSCGGRFGVLSACILAIGLVAGLGVHGWLWSHRPVASQGLTVTGSVKERVTADLAKWTAGFSRRADLTNVKEVMGKVEEDRNKLKGFIKSLGIEESAIQFQAPQTNPVYEQLSGYGMTQNVIGYTVTQEVRVESGDIEKIETLSGKVKDIVSLDVIPDYQRTEYFYTKLSELRPDLYAKATEDAKVRAVAIAKGTGAKIGGLKEAKTGVIQITPPNSLDISDYGAYDLSTKEKEVTATVSVTFELTQE